MFTSAVFADSTLQWLMRAEGVFFWIQSALLVAVLVHTVFSMELLSSKWVVPKRLVVQLNEIPMPAGVDEASRLLSRHDSSLSDILQLVLHSPDLPRGGSLETVVADGYEDALISMERRLGYLGVFAHVAMLSGLLGTVWGLVGTFTTIGQTNVAPEPSALAGGVSQALLTTIVGLLIAIPTMLCYVHLHGKASRRLYELRTTAAAIASRWENAWRDAARGPLTADEEYGCVTES